MTTPAGTLVVRRADARDSLDALRDAAYHRALSARGGVALLEQMWGSEIGRDEVREGLARRVAAGDVWVALDGDVVVAGVLIADQCVQAVWTQPTHRRRGVASLVLAHALNSDAAPVDAWALPGDRATKSFYESVGWKARLLTMRGA